MLSNLGRGLASRISRSSLRHAYKRLSTTATADANAAKEASMKTAQFWGTLGAMANWGLAGSAMYDAYGEPEGSCEEEQLDRLRHRCGLAHHSASLSRANMRQGGSTTWQDREKISHSHNMQAIVRYSGVRRGQRQSSRRFRRSRRARRAR